MNTERFESLVEELTRVQRENPKAFLRRTMWMVVLGYAYVVALIVLGFVALAISLVLAFVMPILGLVMAISVIAFVFAVIRSNWTLFPEPRGRKLRRGEALQLLALAEEARKLSGAPRWHAAYVTSEMNASVQERPRLGMLGWHRVSIVIGLPILLMTTRDELASILAHEMGHLTLAHSRVGAWVGRQQATWSAVAARTAPGLASRFVLRPFLSWFMPRLNARVFVLGRAQEREADELARRAGGSRAAADALIRVALAARFADEKVWEPLGRLATTSREPAKDGPMARLAEAAKQPFPAESQAWLDASLRLATTSADTHPCLRERLEALGESPRLPPAIERSSGEELLGPELEVLAREIDDAWRAEIAAHWRQVHAASEDGRRNLEKAEAALAVAASGSDDALDALCRRAVILEQLEGDGAALSAWQQILEEHPSDPRGSWHVGRLLLERGDESGVPLVEQAMGISRGFRRAGADFLHAWHDRRGERAAALRNAALGESLDEEWGRAMRERNSVSVRKLVLLPHDLTARQEREAREHLAAIPKLRRAWLCKRQVAVASDVPAHVLVIEHARKWWKLESSEVALRVARQAAGMPHPGTLHLYARGMTVYPGMLKLARTTGAPFFERT